MPSKSLGTSDCGPPNRCIYNHRRVGGLVLQTSSRYLLKTKQFIWYSIANITTRAVLPFYWAANPQMGSEPIRLGLSYQPNPLNRESYGDA